MLKNISVSNLEIYNSNIIDVRSREKYSTSHIPNSINIESNLLIANPEKYLEKNKKYFIYCQYGKTSVKICIALSREGYDVINIIGGYESWLLK